MRALTTQPIAEAFVAASDLTAARVRELLSYDPETGFFTWLLARGCVPAGAIAGSIDNRRVRFGVDGRYYLAHRLAWLWMTGEWPTADIDHIDGDPANNRWSNLRDVNRSTNVQNVRRARKNNKAGLLGVSPHGKSWRAVIGVEGKRINVGTFETPQLAHDAYLNAKRALHAGNML